MCCVKFNTLLPKQQVFGRAIYSSLVQEAFNFKNFTHIQVYSHTYTSAHCHVHCNTLQHTAAHCDSLQLTATTHLSIHAYIHISTLLLTECACSMTKECCCVQKYSAYVMYHTHTHMYTHTHTHTHMHTHIHICTRMYRYSACIVYGSPSGTRGVCTTLRAQTFL